MKVQVTLPDGSNRHFEKGVSFSEVAESIGRKLAKASLGVRTNETTLLDMQRTLEADTTVSFVTADTEDGLEIIRHSTTHVLAMAVQRLWKDVKRSSRLEIDSTSWPKIECKIVFLNFED